MATGRPGDYDSFAARDNSRHAIRCESKSRDACVPILSGLHIADKQVRMLAKSRMEFRIKECHVLIRGLLRQQIVQIDQ
jgi:hypothetical protein